MNCLEVHRKLMIEPDLVNTGRDTELVAHLQQCTSCHAFAESLVQLDSDIRETIAIPLPDNLSSRILLKRHVLNRRQHRQRRQLAYSMAAGMLLFISVFTLNQFSMTQPGSLPAQALAHVKNEQDYLSRKDNKNLQEVNAILGKQNMRLNAAIAPVRFIENCMISSKKSIHMIIEGRAGPVTLLVMGDSHIPEQLNISDERFKGLVIPLFNNNSVAVIGEKQEQIQEVIKRLLPALQPV